jgi:thiol-disulfide isomerase/thioredoxin
VDGFTCGVPKEPQLFIREEDSFGYLFITINTKHWAQSCQLFHLEVEMKKRIVLSLSVMIGMTIMLILCLQVVRAASPSQPECPSCNSFGIQRFQEKKQAPSFSLKSLDGKQVSLSDFKGKPVVIVFWATW